MKKYVAILRGINVGGHRKILMSDLKTLLLRVGFKNISTYIQSGNVAFESNDSVKKNKSVIHTAINDKYGYDVPVIIREKKELDLLIENNPFITDVDFEIEKLSVVFFDKEPEENKLKAFNELTFGEDDFYLTKDHAYLKFKTKASNSKLTHSVFESKLKVVCSARNWKTVLKLRDMFSVSL